MKPIEYPTPTEPGLYWAREQDKKYFNLIVSIVGKYPANSCRVFDRNNGVMDRFNIVQGDILQNVVWGPKIEEPPSFRPPTILPPQATQS